MKKSRLGLLQTDIIATLNQDELSKFNHEILTKGSVLYTENIKIVIFKNGIGKLSFFEDGEEFIIYHLHKDNMTILDSSCVIEALEDSEIYSLNIDLIEHLFGNFAFNKACSKTLFNIILLQHQITKSILFEGAKGRIANFLIELAKEQDLKQNGYYYIFLPFSLTVLSSFVGLKRQSASTVFNELLKDDVIRRLSPHEFLIVDYEKLQSYTANQI